MTKINTIYDKIKGILEDHPATRDCDLSLINVLARDYHRGRQVYLHEILKYIKTGLFPSFSSIYRLRRKVQQLHPELRGTKETQRGLLEEKTRKDMREFIESTEKEQGVLL